MLLFNFIGLKNKKWFKAKKLRYSLADLLSRLRGKDSDEALFALQMIESLYNRELGLALELGLQFQAEIVKIFALKKIEELKIFDLLDWVDRIVADENESVLVRNSALITSFALGRSHFYKGLETGYLYGLLRYGQNHEQKTQAIEMIKKLLSSSKTHKVVFSIELIAEFRLQELYSHLLALFSFKPAIKPTLIQAIAKIGNHPEFLPYLLNEIEGEMAFRQAIDALSNFGEQAIQLIRAEFGRSENSIYLSRLIRVCSKMPGKSEAFLLEILSTNALQPQIIGALKALNYKTKTERDTKLLIDEIDSQILFAYTLLRCIFVLDSKRPKYDLLVQAITSEYEIRISNLAQLLWFLTPSHKDPPVPDFEDFIRNLIPKCQFLTLVEIKKLNLLISDMSLTSKIEELSEFYHFPLNSDSAILGFIIDQDNKTSHFGPWTKTVALESMDYIDSTFFLKKIVRLLESKNPFLSRAAFHLLSKTAKTNDMNIQEFLSKINVASNILNINTSLQSKHLLDIEKVIILKRTDLFSQTPENILIDIVRLTKEVSFKKDEVIFEKGMLGDCMYVIYEGRVRIHVEGYTLVTLINGDFFGELGLLDTGQRSANATCESDTLLLRIDQEDFYELTESRPEIAKGVIKALCEIIRNQSYSIENLKAQISKPLY